MHRVTISVFFALLLLKLLEECFGFRWGSGTVQRLAYATLYLCAVRCQCCLVRFLRRLAGAGFRWFADLIDRRVYLVSHLAECFGYLFLALCGHKFESDKNNNDGEPPNEPSSPAAGGGSGGAQPKGTNEK
jgi:hypothetical protein